MSNQLLSVSNWEWKPRARSYKLCMPALLRCFVLKQLAPYLVGHSIDGQSGGRPSWHDAVHPQRLGLQAVRGWCLQEQETVWETSVDRKCSWLLIWVQYPGNTTHVNATKHYYFINNVLGFFLQWQAKKSVVKLPRILVSDWTNNAS